MASWINFFEKFKGVGDVCICVIQAWDDWDTNCDVDSGLNKFDIVVQD